MLQPFSQFGSVGVYVLAISPKKNLQCVLLYELYWTISTSSVSGSSNNDGSHNVAATDYNVGGCNSGVSGGRVRLVE